MGTHRIEKINELIKKVLGEIILEEEDFGPGILVTLMAVDTSADLQHARIIFSVFPDKPAELVFKKLQADIFLLQQLLNKKLKMRPVPKIRFVLDKTEAEAQEIGELFEKNK